jgi:hypothetical protein
MAELTYTALDLITDAFIEIGATARPASNQRPTRRNGVCAS